MIRRHMKLATILGFAMLFLTGTALAQIGASAVGQAAPAATPLPLPIHAFHGTVVSNGNGGLVVTVDDGTNTTFATTAKIEIHVPGTPGQAPLNAVVAGANVTVVAQKTSAGGWIAQRVTVQGPAPEPVQPAQPQLNTPKQAGPSGLVTAFKPGASLSVQAKDGSETTYQLNAATRVLPQGQGDQIKTGSHVALIFAPQDAGKSTTSLPLWGVVLLP